MVDYEFVRETNALGVFLFIPFISSWFFLLRFFLERTHTWNLGGGCQYFSRRFSPAK